MAKAKPWRFIQLEGGNDAKTLELRGWSAPFGRPRQKALTHHAQRTRQSKRTYPGVSAPTRHIWGEAYEDIVLEGRFMDVELGVNGAKAKVRECQEFKLDNRRIQVEWGDMIGATGLMTEFDPAFESESHVAWRIVIEVDDNILRVRRPPTVTLNATANVLITQIPRDAAPLFLAPSLLDQLQGLSNALLDLVDDQVSIVTGAFGQLARAADLITTLEQAGDDELSRLRQGIGQAMTAVITLADLYESIDKADETSAGGFLDVESVATISSPWTSDENARLAWSRFRLQQAAIMNQVLAEMAELDAQAELAERGLATTMATARDGDTWESLALALYGDVNQATTLRAANGAQYGSLPVVGPIIVPPAQAPP